ncbi:hypothetical protein ACTHQ0_16015 [Priestia megaterium]|nr:hypothetical protein [Priestia megaterium]
MKYKLNKSKILKADDIWNAVVDLMGEYKFLHTWWKKDGTMLGIQMNKSL